MPDSLLHPAAARTVIPVRCAVHPLPPCDPLAVAYALRRIRGEDDVVVFESVAGPRHDVARSFVAFGRLASIEVRGTRIALSGRPALVGALRRAALESGAVEPVGHRLHLTGPSALFDLLRALNAAFRVEGPALEGYRFGLLGYFGYDVVGAIERLPRRIADGPDLPDVHLSFFAGVVRVDHATGTAEMVATEGPYWGPPPVPSDDALSAQAPEAPTTAPRPRAEHDTATRERFEEKTRTALEHILDGDVYQVQVGHEIRIDSDATPGDVYLRLRARNPSPYCYLAPAGRATLVGASPEVLFRLAGRRIVMRPLAGTVRRGATEEEDAANVARLRSDPKEIAEHVMLVDLCRNDMGRVCEPGSLEVTELLAVERYSHVHHLVSNVEAQLSPGLDAFDALRATFVAGTLSGAPKVRAMEIIEALEDTRRGVYAGCVGFVDAGGDSTLALCIRTAVRTPEGWSVRAAAGIVADSVPTAEWNETLAKMGAPYWAVTGKELRP